MQIYYILERKNKNGIWKFVQFINSAFAPDLSDNERIKIAIN